MCVLLNPIIKPKQKDELMDSGSGSRSKGWMAAVEKIPLQAAMSSVLAASQRPLWAKLMPCEHNCIGVDVVDDKLILECPDPCCGKSKVVHMDELDADTVWALTVSLVEDRFERMEKKNLS